MIYRNSMQQILFMHYLITKIKKEDDKNVPLICQQLYDLAMMAHKQLSPDEMTQFIARSNQILLALAK